MNCHETQALLHGYADGELDLVNALAVENHLKGCAVCGGAVRQIESIHLALQHPELSYRAPNELRRQIAKATQARTEKTRVRWSWSLPSFAMGSICAAVAVLLMATLTSPIRNDSTDEIVASHVRSLMAEHLTDVQSSDSHTVKPWFTGKLDFTVPVKDFAAEGFPLVGGRLDYIGGRPGAALGFKRKRDPANVFFWATARADSPPRAKANRGFSIAETDANGLHFTGVSDLNRDDLDQLLGLLTR